MDGEKAAEWMCAIQATGNCGHANSGVYQNLVNNTGNVVNVTVKVTNFDAFGTAQGSYTTTHTVQPGGREPLGCTHHGDTSGRFVQRAIVAESRAG